MALHEGLSAGDRTSRPTVKKISAGEITVTRTFSDRFDLELGPMIPVADAFNVIVQMRDFEAHRLWRRGELVYEGGHSKASLAITENARELAKELIARVPFPPCAEADALHIAICAEQAVAYLVTWDGKHIANARLHVRIQRVCVAWGYQMPELCTPTALMKE